MALVLCTIAPPCCVGERVNHPSVALDSDEDAGRGSTGRIEDRGSTTTAEVAHAPPAPVHLEALPEVRRPLLPA